jgi:formiminotetrahydrofolate cyclodeaminase
VTADELRSMTLQQLLDALAAKTPTPGGGAVAPIVAALGASLAHMVLNYSVGRKSLAAFDQSNRLAMARLQESIRTLPDLAAADAEAYGRLNRLFKLDASDPMRVREWNDAVHAAINAPHRALAAAGELLTLLDSLASTTNRTLASDLAIAAVLAEAAARSAAWNERVNLPLLEDVAERDRLARELDCSLEAAMHLAQSIERACRAE